MRLMVLHPNWIQMHLDAKRGLATSETSLFVWQMAASGYSLAVATQHS